MEQRKPFVPWRDDALLECESLYALWNKFAWFTGFGPAELVRSCRRLSSPAAPASINFRTADWLRFLDNPQTLPLIHGKAANETAKIHAAAMEAEVPVQWSSQDLRVCQDCISQGIHLRVHQHLAVVRCPLHGCVLRNKCDACGRKLSLVSWRNQAFSCSQCSHSLLNGPQLLFGMTASFRNNVNTICEGVVGWLQVVSAETRHALEGCEVGFNADEGLPNLHERGLMIAAIRQSSRDIPSWMMVPDVGDANVSISRIVPLATSLGAAIQHGKAVADWRVKHDSPSHNTLDRQQFVPARSGPETSDRYLRALQRVAARFIRFVTDLHHDCIESAALIATITQGDREPFSPAMMLCCPVALGYWLWRRRGSEIWPDSLSSSGLYLHVGGIERVGAGTDLLLYSLERSDLHACVLVAHECIREWQETDDTSRALTMLSAWEALRRQAPGTSADLSWLDFDTEATGITFVRVDASRMIQASKCLGMEPFYEVLRHRLRSVPIFSPATRQVERYDMEETWEERAKHHVSHLAPRGELKAWGRRCNTSVFFAMRNLRLVDRGCFDCLDSAISARQSPGSHLVDLAGTDR